MPTLSGRPAALSEAGTALRPSDALATCLCELEAVPDAPLRAREPHSAPQHSAARRLPREPLAASHRPPTALPSRRRPVAHGVAGAVRRPSATVAIGSCEPEAAHSAALPVREPHSVPQTAAARRSPRGSPEALHRLRPHVPSEGVLPRSTKRGVVRLGRPPLAEAALLDARRRGGVVGAWHRACRRRLAVRRGRASGTRKLRESSRDGGWEIFAKTEASGSGSPLLGLSGTRRGLPERVAEKYR